MRTNASMASAIGVARMPTQGSWRPVVTTSSASPRILIDLPGIRILEVGFKAMLAGANLSLDHTQGTSYRLSPANMVRLVLSYGSHAIQSPGLIPSLAKEGLTGFIDYYVRSHKNFLRPFSYIPWDLCEFVGSL